MRKALYAAALLSVALAVLLVAWFLAGWSDVRARQAAQRAAPIRAAEARAVELAQDLRGELTSLLAREIDRPYFHYQNLFRDPRASRGTGVTPSPLATGPSDSLVMGYFQLDAKGRATTPTINDDVPELSEPRQIAGNLAFRGEVIRSLSAQLAPPPSAVVVAQADPPAMKPRGKRPPAVAVNVEPAARPAQPITQPQLAQQADPITPQQVAQQQVAQQQQAQVITLDRSSYAQNNFSNRIYQENAPDQVPQRATKRVTPASGSAPPRVAPEPAQPAAVVAPPPEITPPAVTPPAATARVTPPRRSVPAPVGPVAAPLPDEPEDPVTIIVSSFEWRTLPFAGVPALVAVRDVATPDGGLVQGFVIDRATLTAWLAKNAGDAIVELRTADDASAGPEIAPGWHLDVAAHPRALAQATVDAAHLASSFLLRFILIGIIAALAAGFVVLLVARSEKLASERSQFAAAAAHELRTPLAGLQLYGDMLADGLGDPAKQRDYARRMSEEAARLGRVVSNVLGFSQLERGNLSVEPEVARLDEELRRLAERAQPALDRAGAVLSLEVSSELRAKFDRDALARIVGNLLDNAEKYGRDAEDRTIELSAKQSGDAVEVIIADHGPGIGPHVRARLFRPFARGVSADGPAGLGLGLALSQSLARAMGGELEYRAPASGGAVFVLRLMSA